MDCIGSAVFCRCSAAGRVRCFRHLGSTLEKAPWHIHAKIHFHQPEGARGFPGSLFNYRRAVLLLRRQHDYPLNCVMNMDQTMLRFDMLSQRTSDKKGCRQVRTKTTRAEKTGVHCSLVCCSRWDKVPSNDRLQGTEWPDPSTGLPAAAGVRQRPSSCHEKWVDDSRGSDGMDQGNPGQGRRPPIVGAG